MSSLELESTTAPSIDGEPIEIHPGDCWPLPFRGSRYTLKAVEGRIKFCWSHMDKVYAAEKIPGGLLKAFGAYKLDTRGSLRITPHREVITKVAKTWEPVYLGKIKDDLEFEGFNLNPEKYEVGRIWKGFHFKHGEVFAVWAREGSGDYLYWSKQGIYFRTIDEHPELCSRIREIRPRCGRLYITETGHIWMNLPATEISSEWLPTIRDYIEEDKAELANPKYDVVLKSLRDRVRNTRCWPIHIGHVSDYDHGKAPRTHFKTTKHFGLGGEDVDDEDGYDADSWKRMKRDY
jgi:hypothetical protein